jgi:hypothetical protein
LASLHWSILLFLLHCNDASSPSSCTSTTANPACLGPQESPFLLHLAEHSCQLTADSGIATVSPLPFSLPQMEPWVSSTWKWWRWTAKVGIYWSACFKPWLSVSSKPEKEKQYRRAIKVWIYIGLGRSRPKALGRSAGELEELILNHSDKWEEFFF